MGCLMFLRLEGVFQSWGERSRWDHRDTSSMPTKSGIVGLIACSMGIPRGSEKIKEIEESIKVAVRADCSGNLVKDYQTLIGMLTNAEGELVKVEGLSKDDKRTKVIPKQYIQDASFLVIVQSTKEKLEEYRKALKNPVWPYYLGRKSCVPTRPVFADISDKYHDMEQALCEYPLSKKVMWEKYRKKEEPVSKTVLCQIESAAPPVKTEFRKTSRRDIALGNPSRHYLLRDVWEFSVVVEGVED